MTLEKRNANNIAENITEMISVKTQKQLMTLQVLNALTNIIRETKPTNFVDGTTKGGLPSYVQETQMQQLQNKWFDMTLKFIDRLSEGGVKLSEDAFEVFSEEVTRDNAQQ
jgi:hypothetical protein